MIELLVSMLSFGHIDTIYPHALGKSMLMWLVVPLCFFAIRPKIIWIFYAPFVVSLFASIFNDSIIASYIGLYHRGGGVIHLLALGMLANIACHYGKDMTKAVIVITLAHSVYCIYQGFFVDPFLWFKFEKSVGIAGNSNIAASLIVFGIAILLKTKIKCLLPIYIAALYFVDSKAGWAISATIITYHYFGISVKSATVMIVLATLGYIFLRKSASFYELFDLLHSSRFLIAKDTVMFMIKKPMIFLVGHGHETYNILSTPMPSFPVEVYDSSHNNYLDKIVQGGIFNMIAHYGLVAIAWIADKKASLFYLSYVLLSFSIFDSPATDIILWTMLGVSCSKLLYMHRDVSA